MHWQNPVPGLRPRFGFYRKAHRRQLLLVFLCAASAHLYIGQFNRLSTIRIMVSWAGALRRAVSLRAVVSTLFSSPPKD